MGTLHKPYTPHPQPDRVLDELLQAFDRVEALRAEMAGRAGAFITLRRQHGYTLKALADRLGVHQTYLVSIEAGRRTPSAEIARNLATILNNKD